MDVVPTLHWVALFLAFLGPLLGGPVAFDWLFLVMLSMGIVTALATYNSGVNTNGVVLLLLATLAVISLPPTVGYNVLTDYLTQVLLLGAWYVAPIAVAQGWRSLLS